MPVPRVSAQRAQMQAMFGPALQPVQFLRDDEARKRRRTATSPGTSAATSSAAAAAAASSSSPSAAAAAASSSASSSAAAAAASTPASPSAAAAAAAHAASDDDASDPDWTPFLAMDRRFARAQAGEARYPMEETSRDWAGETHRIETAAGPFTFHRGRGQQPYIRTRREDFAGANVDDDYDSIVRVLSDANPRVEERRAYLILRMARGGRPSLAHETAQVRRAMTYLLGLTQVAEESRRRTPGSAAAARASLRTIADGTSTFHAQFNRTNGLFVAARRGGTAAMREVAAGKRQLDEDVAGNVSDSDDDDVAQRAEIDAPRLIPLRAPSASGPVQRKVLDAVFGPAIQAVAPPREAQGRLAPAMQLQHGARNKVIQACGNPVFQQVLDYLRRRSEGAGPGADQPSSATFAERSLSGGLWPAFIINAILPVSEVERIPEVLRAMVEGLDARDGQRVTVVLGINAPEERRDELARGVARALALIQPIPFPVAIVPSTFRGPFPYGTMRNAVLHSRKTRSLTEYFRTHGFHPYVSFQDFDTGSRRVGSEHGLHVFHAIDRVLAGTWDDPMEDFENPVRPLMIAGRLSAGRAAATDCRHPGSAAGSGGS
jgi:hypothetical protein